MTNAFTYPDWIDDVPDISRQVSLIKFYEIVKTVHSIMGLLGDKALSMPATLSSGDKTHMLYADFFDSIDNTLKSILVCTKMGNFSDANILLRKYRDNLFQWLFIIDSIEIIDGKKLDEILGVEPGDESSDQSVDSLCDALLSWFQDLELSKNWRKEYFDITPYLDWFMMNSLVKTCFDNYLKPTWEYLGADLNNYTHGNGKKFLISNNIQAYSNEIITDQVEGLIDRVWKTTACFLSILILNQPLYLMSSNYIDHFGNRITVPEDSQYWIEPIFQNFFGLYITQIHPDLKKFLKENNLFHMEIE